MCINDYTNLTSTSTSLQTSQFYTLTDIIDGLISKEIQLSYLAQELYTQGLSWLIKSASLLLLTLLCSTIIKKT